MEASTPLNNIWKLRFPYSALQKLTPQNLCAQSVTTPEFSCVFPQCDTKFFVLNGNKFSHVITSLPGECSITSSC